MSTSQILWGRVVRVSDTLTDPTERRRVRLLVASLAVMAFTALIGLVVQIIMLDSIPWPMLGATSFLVVAYLLARTDYHVLGAGIAFTAFVVPSFAVSLSLGTENLTRANWALTWLVAGMMASSLVLKPRGAIAVAGGSYLGAWLVPLALGRSVSDFALSISLLTVIGVLSAVVAMVQDRNRRDLADELAKRERAETGLRAAKSSLETRVSERTAELQATNERLRALVESSPVAVIIVDGGGIVRTWNPAAERILGWNKQDVIGQTCPLVLRESDAPDARNVDWERDPATHIDRELVTCSAERAPVHVSVSTAPLRDSNGRNVGVVALLLDVSARIRLEDELRHAQKLEAVGQLAGGVAHDFNNILTIITGLSATMLFDAEPETQAHADLTSIRDAAQRAATLTRQLLAFARKQVLHPQIIEINEVLESMRPMLRRLLRENVDLNFRLGPATGAIEADPSQIEQVVLNLAVNAADAMARGGTLTIGTQRLKNEDGDWVLLRIADTGIGMSPGVRARVFDPFFTTKPLGEGTGLGLSTVYGIVSQSDGDIEVTSETAAGTTFSIRFPRVDATDGTEEAAREELPRGEETILVVEDEPVVRALAARILRRQGYTVLTAENGYQAVQVGGTTEGPIDLVLADVVMPALGGPECIAELRLVRDDFRVLYMSGHAERALNDLDHSLLLTKPFRPIELAVRVREILDG